MEDIKSKLGKYQIKKPASKIKYSYQALGKELQEYFKTNVWWLFHKYPEQKLYEAYKACQAQNKTEFRYLLGILKKNGHTPTSGADPKREG